MTVGELERIVDDRVSRGRCGCGCGGEIPVPVEGKRKRQRFLPDHRQRVYKRKVQAAAAERGLEPRLSLARLQTPTAIGDRNGHAPVAGTPGVAPQSRRAGSSGAQIAYFKALRVLAAHFESEGMHPPYAREKARGVLRPALPDKQRARLNADG